jgi:peptidoglycan-associated lipoprotein
MNPMIRSAIVTTALLTSLALLNTGCSKKSVFPPDSSTSGISEGNNINYPTADSPYSESGLAGEESMDNSGGQGMGNLSVNSGEDVQSEQYRRTHGRSSITFSPVYFNFDQAGVSIDMQAIVSSNATYMKNNLDTVIVIEGNCDERGTNEYNLALGERRAINVKEYMVNLGVFPQRIRTVSYGEERPLFTDSNELDWAQNRRADTILE